MPDLMTAVGAAAAICTSVSYFPQVRKVWDTGETGDLSLKMLLLLCCGLTLWVVYGVLRGDYVIIAANAVSVVLVGFVLYFKLRNEFRPRGSRVSAGTAIHSRLLSGDDGLWPN